MRTALFLLLLLAIAAVPGSLVPQRGVDARAVEAYFLDHPKSAPTLDKLGFFSVYTSPWFSAVYLLLMVSLIGCIVPRSFVYLRALRARPPKAPRNFSRLPASASFETSASVDEVIAAGRQALGRARVDVVDGGAQRRARLPARGRQPGVPHQRRRGAGRRRGRHAVRLSRLGDRDGGAGLRQLPDAVRRVRLRIAVQGRPAAAVLPQARPVHRQVPAARQPAGRRTEAVPGAGDLHPEARSRRAYVRHHGQPPARDRRHLGVPRRPGLCAGAQGHRRQRRGRVQRGRAVPAERPVVHLERRRQGPRRRAGAARLPGLLPADRRERSRRGVDLGLSRRRQPAARPVRVARRPRASTTAHRSRSTSSTSRR